ncbi:cyclin-dependent kinase 2-associated protein 1-like [Anthonomus grandis grandis]|uniref:cyclin-dependent kinase 2-associated protein 1-like n=1 Tax=Anthonomus grandis grandis TaxID=2921223 RepID=UPI0021656494|nr:cyclin-dependent kinase 2-associated protein 1-like [Anthonomus grandis grandis]
METVDIQAVESKLSDVTVTAIPISRPPQNHGIYKESHSNQNHIANNVSVGLSSPQAGISKYAQLLNAIEEMGREVRPTYAGSRSSAERLKKSIVSARILVRECLIETERSARQ